MRIAILGATSMLAADFAAESFANGSPYDLTLFARDPARAKAMQVHRRVAAIPPCQPLAAFGRAAETAGAWDAIINFVGVGDPARAVAMGTDILRVTREWDDRVLEYLGAHSGCRYLFLSSGAALGAGHADAIGPDTQACFAINALAPSAWYGVAKFYAEALHRSQLRHSIIDIRVFNYLSEFADLNHRFLVNEAIAAIRDGRVLGVAPGEMWRDYLGASDFARLVTACLQAPEGYNGALDAYSRAPVSKTQLLALLRDRFGLRFEIGEGGINATGRKSIYYSQNRAAEALGYLPLHGSIETLALVAERILARPSTPV